VIYALEKIVSPNRICLVAALHLNDPEWLTRAYAARTLGRQKSPRGTAYLIDRLVDPDPAVVVNALRSLQQIGDSTCGPCTQRLTRALGHPDPYVRVSAATVLAERFAFTAGTAPQKQAALDSLASHLRDPDAATRGACARALLARRGAAALDAVRPVLADTSVYARVAVIQALALLDSASALPLLLPRLAAGTPLFDRSTAAEAIGTLHAVSAAGVLRAGLADSSVLFAASCAGALADLGNRASVPELARTYAKHAGDPDPDARTAIHDALATLASASFADSVRRANPSRPEARPLTDEELIAPPDARGAILHTSKGDIEWAFYGAEAPQTVKNFVRLARRGYFDGLAIHRVVPNFVIQDGDPTGTGSGGPGYTIRCEYNRLRYDAGMVGMALSGKDTGGSQWFITHSPQMHLNGRYTIFAHVTAGMGVVKSIVQGDRVLRVEILN
jgi:cyclophilin family peptidyl-prolyl cis-trans isomerase/HEAT repeat protein